MVYIVYWCPGECKERYSEARRLFFSSFQSWLRAVCVAVETDCHENGALCKHPPAEHQRAGLWMTIPKWGLPRWHSGKEPAYQCKRLKRWGSISGLGRSPGVGNGNLLQYSCLEGSMERGAWKDAVHRIAKSRTWLINWAHVHTHIPQWMDKILFERQIDQRSMVSGMQFS